MIEGVTARIVSRYSRVSDGEGDGRFSSFMSGDGDDDRQRGERDAVPFKHQASTDTWLEKSSASIHGSFGEGVIRCIHRLKPPLSLYR